MSTTPKRRPLITFNPDDTLTVAIGPLAEPPEAVTPRFPEPLFVMASGVAVFMAPGTLDVMIAVETTKLKAKLAASDDPKTGRFEDLLPIAAMQTAKGYFDALLAGELPDPADLKEAQRLEGWALMGFAGQSAPSLMGVMRRDGESGASQGGVNEGDTVACLDSVMAGRLVEGGFALLPEGYVRLGKPAQPEAGLLRLLLAKSLH
jgi:hypothetical protein